jgi:hypothetical protein
LLFSLQASGNLGPAILKGLLDTGAFNVTVLSRKESTATFPPQVKAIKTDYSDAHLAEVFAGQDAVISNINAGQMDVQRRTIDAAARAGVKRYLPSEFGANTTTEEGQRVCFLFGSKVQAVTYLRQKASENPNFSWSAVVTGPFFGMGHPFVAFPFFLLPRNISMFSLSPKPPLLCDLFLLFFFFPLV